AVEEPFKLGCSRRFCCSNGRQVGRRPRLGNIPRQGPVLYFETPIARHRKFPRLETLRYRPAVSVTFSGSHVKFFDHSQREKEPSFRVVAPLVLEWLLFFLLFWFRTLPRLLVRPLLAGRRSRQMYK